METQMNPNDPELTETASLVGMSEAAGLAGTASPETVGRIRRRLVSGWHFTRHLLEMVAAMMAGMAVLGVVIWALDEPPGYANPLVEYGLMGACMSAPMVAWMRYRGHSWSDGLEMTAAMLLPMLALVLAVELGVAGPTGHTLMMLSHVVMIGGMVALMIYRRDRYAHGPHVWGTS
jgi:flagellar biosynthetic protein FliP